MARKSLMKGFKKPKGIIFEHSTVENTYGKFVAYPFERGFGTTTGNTCDVSFCLQYRGTR